MISLPNAGILACGLAMLWNLGCATRTPQAKHPKHIQIEKAKLPFKIIRTSDRKPVPAADFYQAASNKRALCLGETHTNPHHHWMQLHLVNQLAHASSQPRALGLEMVQRPFAQALEDYGNGKISERAMLQRTKWKERWGFSYQLYRPIVQSAIQQKMKLLALNADQDVVRTVARKGLSALSPKQKKQLSQLNLKDKEHRDWFDAQMRAVGHGHSHGHKSNPDKDKAHAAAVRGDRIYAAQVIWDETMAESAAAWLKQDPTRQIIILAGSGHCHKSAIIRRLLRRGIESAISVHPIMDTGHDELSPLLSDPIHDYLFVLRGYPE